MNYDVIILGGGAIGACAAYESAKSGLRTLLLEKRHISSGASGSSAAMLEVQVEANRGDPFFSLSKASLNLFPALEQEIEHVTGMGFQFDPSGIIQVALAKDDEDWLKEEVKRQTDMGLSAEWMNPETLQAWIPSLNTAQLGGAFFKEDGQINGEMFTSSLVSAARNKGAHIVIECGETEFIKDGAKIAGVTTRAKRYHAETFVLASGAWTDQVLAQIGIQLGIYPVRGQLLVFETPNNFLPCPVYTKKNGYVVPKRDGYTLAGTTVENAGFDESTTEDARTHILKMAVGLFPNFSKKTIRGMSAGLRPGSPDGLPFIGPLADYPNVIVATAHFRNGMLLAPITATVVKNFLQKNSSAFDVRPFSPNRALTHKM